VSPPTDFLLFHSQNLSIHSGVFAEGHYMASCLEIHLFMSSRLYFDPWIDSLEIFLLVLIFIIFIVHVYGVLCDDSVHVLDVD
jgi:hypothetical protein